MAKCVRARPTLKSVALLFAPLDSRAFMADVWPNSAARCKGVSPCSSSQGIGDQPEVGWGRGRSRGRGSEGEVVIEDPKHRFGHAQLCAQGTDGTVISS